MSVTFSDPSDEEIAALLNEADDIMAHAHETASFLDSIRRMHDEDPD